VAKLWCWKPIRRSVATGSKGLDLPFSDLNLNFRSCIEILSATFFFFDRLSATFERLTS
jgi:hypothetical protein